jgi:hypothetical protein
MGLIAAAAMLGNAPAAGQARLGDQTTKPDSLERKAIQDKIGETLKDPYSAQYTFERWGIPQASFRGATRTVCGTVNAKNSFGGYVGRRAFMVTTARAGDNFDLFDLAVASSDAEDTIVSSRCLIAILNAKAP